MILCGHIRAERGGQTWAENTDVIFREDACLAKKDNSPKNLNIIRKIAMRLLNAARSGRETKKLVMLKASLNPDAMLDVLFQRKS